MNHHLNLYYIFYITAKCGNISQAAKSLFISQPAVSKSIAKLEESFKSPLLYRSSRGVSLTDTGVLLYRQLETAFQAIHQGEEQVRRSELLEEGHLSIGVSATLCKYVLLPYLQQFIQANPHIQISISCQPSNETIAALEKGQLDIGLIGEPQRGNSLCFRPLTTISDVFVATGDYLDLLKRRVAAEGLPAEAGNLLSHTTLLMLHKENMSRQHVDKYLLLQGITAGQQLEVTTMDLLIDFAKIGLGAACVIKDFVKKELEEGSLVELHTKEPIPSRQIGFAFPGKRQPTLPMERFMNTVSCT